MAHQHTVAHHAILIGINAYPSSPLKSCVRDVQLMKEMLGKAPYGVDIQTLTADNTSAEVDLLSRACWPTCSNVTAAIQRTTAHAKRGDFVYIHYSGHGTRLPPPFARSNQSTDDLALVLLHEDGEKETVFVGSYLAHLLKGMTDKGLIVTVVLDCCFSASVYRDGDSSARYLPLDDATASMTSSGSYEALQAAKSRSPDRDGSMHDNWLLDPEQYTIHAACGPHEKAKGGFEVGDGGGRYGALSYHLHSALSTYGLRRRHRDIHRYLCGRFWETSMKQNPVLYGNCDQGFFGQADLDVGDVSMLLINGKGQQRLMAGQAHGVSEGDMFNISSKDGQVKLDARVIYAGPLTSRLQLLGTQADTQIGNIAKPISCLQLANFPLRLAPNVPRREEWVAILSKRSLRLQYDDAERPAFEVVLSTGDEYEIRDGSKQRLPNVPTMPQQQTNIEQLCDVLEHLARFNMVKELGEEAPQAAFQDLFDIKILSNGKSFGPKDRIDVLHKDFVCLRITNKGDTALYAFIYNLGALWQVKEIQSANYEVIPSPDSPDKDFKGYSQRKIRMVVPDIMREHGSCEDIIKVFVASQPTSFDCLNLPKLNALTELKPGNRTSSATNSTSENWAAVNFHIHTRY